MPKSPSAGRRSARFLAALVFLCLLFTALLHFHVSLTGIDQVDGIAGVLLGLYAASQPVANILDLVLYGRYESVRASFRQVGKAYWLLNGVVLLAAWATIATSLLRYSRLT